jgi:hypothetical protein
MRQLDQGPIPSPFTSAWQAPSLLALLLTLLILPILVHVLDLNTAENRYLEMDSHYRYIHHVIYEQPEDLDVLFLGTCYFLNGLDIPAFQDVFSKKMGRPAKVEMLATKFGGEDFEYVMLRDFLRHRKVKLLVTGMPGAKGSPDAPHVLAPYWIRLADVVELGAGQPWFTRARLYALAVLAAPRHLLGVLRPESLRWGKEKDSWGMEETRFCLDHTDFQPLSLSTEQLSKRDWTFEKGASSPLFEFKHTGLPPYRKSNFAKIVELARRHGTAMANLQMTTRSDTQSSKVVADANWEEYFDYPIAQVGIPPADYFRGMDSRTIDCLFWDSFHPNKNGATYFSRIVAPTLARIYGEKVGWQK